MQIEVKILPGDCKQTSSLDGELHDRKYFFRYTSTSIRLPQRWILSCLVLNCIFVVDIHLEKNVHNYQAKNYYILQHGPSMMIWSIHTLL